MSTDNVHDRNNRPDNQPEDAKEAMDISRREAFGRFAIYTAPVMLALLTSEAAARSSSR